MERDPHLMTIAELEAEVQVIEEAFLLVENCPRLTFARYVELTKELFFRLRRNAANDN